MESRDYTAAMVRDHLPAHVSGVLKICPALGRVMGPAGASVRLGPVNMKVLEALLARAGSVVSRAELYETVWRNQAVGEDALTRCISDIRAELRTLSGRDDWIETLPKRGYRWIGEVRAAAFPESEPEAPVAAIPEAPVAAIPEAPVAAIPEAAIAATPAPPAPEPRRRPLKRTALGLAGRGLAYLAALAVMASLLVWTVDRFAGARAPVVAVLPVSAAPALRDMAAEVDLELTRHFMDLDQVRILSRSAIESRPSNPFPFFYYQFGAQWLVEGDLRAVSGHDVLTISIADARTGIVELQVTAAIADDGAFARGHADSALSALTEFIELQLAR